MLEGLARLLRVRSGGPLGSKSMLRLSSVFATALLALSTSAEAINCDPLRLHRDGICDPPLSPQCWVTAGATMTRLTGAQRIPGYCISDCRPQLARFA
jgi:hypothetical protein